MESGDGSERGREGHCEKSDIIYSSPAKAANQNSLKQLVSCDMCSREVESSTVNGTTYSICARKPVAICAANCAIVVTQSVRAGMHQKARSSPAPHMLGPCPIKRPWTYLRPRLLAMQDEVGHFPVAAQQLPWHAAAPLTVPVHSASPDANCLNLPDL